jgi:hypothetical protein
MHWMCIDDPAECTSQQLGQLLENAHADAKRQYDNRRRRWTMHSGGWEISMMSHRSAVHRRG